MHLFQLLLHLTVGATVLPNSAFGEGSGPVVLDNLMCNGLENRLFDCSHAGLERTSCSHNQDAGIACRAGKEMLSSGVIS